MAKSITIVFPFRLLASDPSYDPTKDILIGLVIAVQWNVIAHAESTDCTTPVIIITDSRITHSTFPQATTYWYGICAQAGHSYSVEFEPPADNYPNAAKVQFTALSVFGPNDSLQACRGTSTVAVTQNSGYSPVILKNGNGAGRRISFTARSAGLHLIAASNVASTGSYSFRVLDTTMFNLRWSTWNGYDDQWGFLNISDMPITGTLNHLRFNSYALTAVQFIIPAGGEVVRFSKASDLNLPRNASGCATLSHNGPPNSIIADAYMISPTGLVVTYTKFEGVSRN